jgi:hypothetical protein
MTEKARAGTVDGRSSNPRPVRKSVLLLVLLATVIGCKAPPSLDEALVGDLLAGIRRTVTAMAIEAPSERALHDQAGLLAIQTPPERVTAIRSGELAADSVIQDARNLLLDLAKRRPELEPPALLIWLIEHPSDLDVNQTLLLDALTQQAIREAHLKDKLQP